MRRAATLALALAASCGGEGTPAGPTASIAPGEGRLLAMELLQDAVAAEMRLYAERGSFTERPGQLDGVQEEVFVVTSGIGLPGRVSVETCAGGDVVVLGTESVEGSVFVVKARGLEPHADGRAVFGHYITDPPCDAADGPEEWPNGYRVSRRGLRGSGGPP